MFEDSLVESAALLRTHNRWPAVVSITAQLCAVAVILAIPLLHPEVLPIPHIISATLAPPPAPPPPAPPIHLETRAATAPPSAPIAPVASEATSIVRDFIHPTGAAVDAPPLPVTDLGNRDSSLPPGINSAPASPYVTVGPSSVTPSGAPLHISSGVLAGNLLAPIRPEYPQIAKITHTEGTVVVDAIISRTGDIESARVVSGPTMLQNAALAAVRQARYRPFLLNGQPTEVQTTITINFRMGG